eukprot:scaffold566_cov364-Pavlova_lutheri.AAC.17
MDQHGGPLALQEDDDQQDEGVGVEGPSGRIVDSLGFGPHLDQLRQPHRSLVVAKEQSDRLGLVCGPSRVDGDVALHLVHRIQVAQHRDPGVLDEPHVCPRAPAHGSHDLVDPLEHFSSVFWTAVGHHHGDVHVAVWITESHGGGSKGHHLDVRRRLPFPPVSLFPFLARSFLHVLGSLIFGTDDLVGELSFVSDPSFHRPLQPFQDVPSPPFHVWAHPGPLQHPPQHGIRRHGLGRGGHGRVWTYAPIPVVSSSAVAVVVVVGKTRHHPPRVPPSPPHRTHTHTHRERQTDRQGGGTSGVVKL